MSVFELTDISFAYIEQPAVRKVSFSVEEGTFVGIVGPNGSGKSTLLKMMDRLIAPDEGTLSLNGRPLASYKRRDIAREIALVPQTFSLDFQFTAREVIEMGRYARKGSGNHRWSVQELLDGPPVVAGPLARVAAHLDHFSRRELEVQAEGLRHEGYLARDVPALVGGERASVERQGPFVRRDEPVHHLEQGALAAAVRSHDAHEGAFLDAERHLSDGRLLDIGERYVSQLEDRHLRSSSSAGR